ncbi:MAG: YkgJ family cysteine cluster protein [Promethearchaeota archaeon]|jgi:Fe-S-cluster containining protein
MVNPEELRFICTRCGNCCTDKDTLVNITYLDILRLKVGLKLDLKEILDVIGFYIFKKNLTEGTLEKMVISPIETEKGLAFTGLLKDNLGKCYFYDKKEAKCLIYDIRPMLCRTFPFSFKKSNLMGTKSREDIQIIYTEKAKNYCPGISTDSPIIEFDHWSQIGRKTLKELEENLLFNERWNKGVRNRKISPKVNNYMSTILKTHEEKAYHHD